MIVGYVRVSTEEQNTARQDTIMTEYKAENIYREKISGKNTNRPELKKMMNFVRDGDTVVVESYSRLARSTKDLLNIVEELQSKGVNFISSKENIDTTTPSGKLMFTIFAGIAEFERTCMLQRQREGIAEAKKQGKYKGRKPIVIDTELFIKTYEAWKKQEITAVQAQKQLDLKPDTFYRRVKAYEQEKGGLND